MFPWDHLSGGGGSLWAPAYLGSGAAELRPGSWDADVEVDVLVEL